MTAKPLLLVEALATGNDSGLGRLSRLFVDGLGGLTDIADILVLLPRHGNYHPPPPLRWETVRARPWRAWMELAFPALILRHRPAAVLCLGQSLPRLRPPSHYALVIPDAGPLENLGFPASSHDRFNRHRLSRRAVRADRIIAISGFTRSRLRELLGYPESRIDVVKPIRPACLPEGAPAAGSGHRAAAVRESALEAPKPAPAHPEGGYFLALGNIEPRKNVPGLIAAYAALASRRPDAPRLFIAGHAAWGMDEARAAAAASGVADRIRFCGHLSEADRPAWLAGCRVFVSASLYEGWGLPLFEALSQGVPSVYHAGGAQDEFARGLALGADARDPEAFSRALETAWCDERERTRLRAAMAEAMPRFANYDLEGALRAALLPLLRLPER